MTNSITIRELTVQEVNQLLADKSFARLKPDTCSRCGAKTGFTRRIFEITGVGKKKQADDETQRSIRFHFKQRYAIDFIFFKTHGNKFFVDSAICGGCGSNDVVYDIEFDQDLISEVANFTGRSETQVKNEFEKYMKSFPRVKPKPPMEQT